MAKLEWGTKRQCLSCGVRFYDLDKKPIICPKCDAPYEVETVLKSRRAQAEAIAKEQLKAAPAAPESRDGEAPDNVDNAEAADDNGVDDVSKEVDTTVQTGDGG